MVNSIPTAAKEGLVNIAKKSVVISVVEGAFLQDIPVQSVCEVLSGRE
jgi:hypothetical protein